jgi:hypothetical protein
MLPDFPETRFEYDQIIGHRVYLKARELSVVEQLIQSITQHEGGQHSYYQEGTGMVSEGYQRVEVEVTVKADDVPSLVGEKLFERLDSIAEEKARQSSGLFYRKMDEVTEKTGNRINAGGAPLTKELLLRMMESTEWSPESVFLTHPAAAEEMSKAWKRWQEDPAFMKQFNDLQSIKKEEWRARENCRKLVD